MGAQQSTTVLSCLLRLCSEIQILRNVKCNSVLEAFSGLPPETQSKIAEKLRQKTEVWNVSGQGHTSAQPELRRELSSDSVSHAVHPTAFPYPMCLSCGALGLSHKSPGSACPGSDVPNRMSIESDPSKTSARIENEILKNTIMEWGGSLERFLADIKSEPERRDFGLSQFALRPKHPNIFDIVLHRFATRELYKCRSTWPQNKLNEFFDQLKSYYPGFADGYLDEKEQRKKHKILLQEGRAFESLANERGLACLFVLPRADTLYQKLPIDVAHDKRKEFIQELDDSGIREEAKPFENLAKRLDKYFSKNRVFLEHVPDQCLTIEVNNPRKRPAPDGDLHVARGACVHTFNKASTTAQIFNSASGGIQSPAQNEALVEAHMPTTQPATMVWAQQAPPGRCNPHVLSGDGGLHDNPAVVGGTNELSYFDMEGPTSSWLPGTTSITSITGVQLQISAEQAGSRLENKRLLPVEGNGEVYAKVFQYDWCKEHRDLCDSVVDDKRLSSCPLISSWLTSPSPTGTYLREWKVDGVPGWAINFMRTRN
ncbi:hypothetical protein CDEST_15362 [Colletotrichum destructivum]|uniref:Uncharacterized protein n=1 Tax=Colletotrichum destructivum TaxID=34406 RepID=A0AAX4J4Q3_9PEZI|nr:hypothetical protein CDEST_15362 [Colletotrichum destructivum]